MKQLNEDETKFLHLALWTLERMVFKTGKISGLESLYPFTTHPQEKLIEGLKRLVLILYTRDAKLHWAIKLRELMLIDGTHEINSIIRDMTAMLEVEFPENKKQDFLEGVMSKPEPSFKPKFQDVNVYYFGTDLESPGHYFYLVKPKQLMSVRITNKDIGFDPELLPTREKGEVVEKGQSKFYKMGNFSVLAYEGSCSDTRGGTKSVFFFKGDATEDEARELFAQYPIINEIISLIK